MSLQRRRGDRRSGGARPRRRCSPRTPARVGTSGSRSTLKYPSRLAAGLGHRVAPSGVGAVDDGRRVPLLQTRRRSSRRPGRSARPSAPCRGRPRPAARSATAVSACPWHPPASGRGYCPSYLARSYRFGQRRASSHRRDRWRAVGRVTAERLRTGVGQDRRTRTASGAVGARRGHAPQRDLGADRCARSARPGAARRPRLGGRSVRQPRPLREPGAHRSRRRHPRPRPAGAGARHPPRRRMGALAGGARASWPRAGGGGPTGLSRRRARWCGRTPGCACSCRCGGRSLPAAGRHRVLVASPRAVARSLRARQGFPLSLGLALWERYTRHALAGLAGHPPTSCATRSCCADSRAVLRPAGPLARHRAERSPVDRATTRWCSTRPRRVPGAQSRHDGEMTSSPRSLARRRRGLDRADRSHTTRMPPVAMGEAPVVDGRCPRAATRVRGALRPVHALRPVAPKDPVLGRARPAPAVRERCLRPRGDRPCPARLPGRPGSVRVLGPEHVVPERLEAAHHRRRPRSRSAARAAAAPSRGAFVRGRREGAPAAAVRPSTSPGSTRTPLTPSSMSSRGPSVAAATTGLPAAMASSTARPNDSACDGCTTTSDPATRSSFNGGRTSPGMMSRSPRPYSATSCCRVCQYARASCRRGRT